MSTTGYPLRGIVWHCLDNGGMAAWESLAEHILNRRIQLGYYKRPAFAEASGISLRTLSDLENARRENYDRNTVAAIEHTLRWAPGSINAILEGGEPTDATADPTPPSAAPTARAASAGDEALIRVMRSPDLTDTQKAAIVRTLIAEQDEFARKRADTLIREALSGN